MLPILLLALPACADLIKPDKLTSRTPAPSVMVGCPLPVEIPMRPLTQKDVETYWLHDRLMLSQCGRKHAILVIYANDTVAALQGAAK